MSRPEWTVIKVNVAQKRVNVAQRTDFVEQILLHQKKKKKNMLAQLCSSASTLSSKDHKGKCFDRHCCSLAIML